MLEDLPIADEWERLGTMLGNLTHTMNTLAGRDFNSGTAMHLEFVLAPVGSSAPLSPRLQSARAPAPLILPAAATRSATITPPVAAIPPNVCRAGPSVQLGATGATRTQGQRRPPGPPPTEAPAWQPPAMNAPVVQAASPQKVSSIFASRHETDIKFLSRVYRPNIFEFDEAAGGVEDDVSSLHLRCAARLHAREMALRTRDMGVLWRLQRGEMREADRFLAAFDAKEASVAAHSSPVLLRHRSEPSWPVPLSRSEPVWPCPSRPDHLDEMARAKPAHSLWR